MKNNMIGGDGYSVNVNEVIGGRPAFPRYSSNYAPIFVGDLLQNGSGKKMKNCGCSKKNDSIYSLIKKYNQNVNNTQQGGSKSIDKKTQFEAIKEVSTSLSILSNSSVKKLITKLFFKNLNDSSKKKVVYKKIGGYTNQLSSILAPLGKNNLLVIASLLLLHYFAVEQKKEKSELKIKKGGDSFIGSLTKILAPTGINALGSVVILALLQEAFVDNKKYGKKQMGGNPLKNLIAPLGTSAFIATGLLIALEKLFTDKVKYINTEDKMKKKMMGGKVKTQLEKLFNMVAPISFNVFTTKKTYKDVIEKLSSMNKK